MIAKLRRLSRGRLSILAAAMIGLSRERTAQAYHSSRKLRAVRALARFQKWRNCSLSFERPGSTHFEIPIEQIAQPGTALDVEVFRCEEKNKFAACQGLFSFILEVTALSAPHLNRRLRSDAWRHESGHEQFRREASWLPPPPGKPAHVHDDGFDFHAAQWVRSQRAVRHWLFFGFGDF
jgi:hypothetical protein